MRSTIKTKIRKTLFYKTLRICHSTPKGIRTPVTGLRILCPGPLDDGGAWKVERLWVYRAQNIFYAINITVLQELSSPPIP